MNRFAILKGLSPPPFKDDIAKEIAETVSRQAQTFAVVPPESPLDVSYIRRRMLGGRPPATNSLTGRFDPRTMSAEQIQAVSGPRDILEEEPFLIITTSSGRNYQVRRSQIHLHQRVRSVRNPEFELHLDLPDNLSLQIMGDLHIVPHPST